MFAFASHDWRHYSLFLFYYKLAKTIPLASRVVVIQECARGATTEEGAGNGVEQNQEAASAEQR